MKFLKEKQIEKSYLLVLGILSICLIGGYFSYAIFTVQEEKTKAISIITGTLNPTLTSTDSAFANNQIVVPASTTKEITVKLTNNNNRNAKFNFYYTGTLPDGVEVGYTSDTKSIPPDASGVVINQGKSEEYTLKIKNSSSSSFTLQIGSDGGLSDKALTFPSNGHLFEEIRKTGAETLLAKVNSEDLDYNTAPSEQQKEMWTFSHVAGTQQTGWIEEELTDYRYIGKDPNNYITFNNETWRIIGIFTTEDKDGNKAKRIKIIRNEVSHGNLIWDRNNSNNWKTSSVYNSLSSLDLTSDARNQIDTVKYYLGGSSSYEDVTAATFYQRERETAVPSGNSIAWIGEIGLMYPSDYGFATSGGSITNRVGCLEKALYNWSDSAYSDCKNNDWLYMVTLYQWTITPFMNSYNLAVVQTDGKVTFNYAFNSSAVRPVIFLKPDIRLTGSGASTDPYIIVS